MARHRFVIHGKQYEVDVGARVGQTVQVTVNGRPYVVGLVAAPAGASAPAPAARPAAAPASTPAAAVPKPAAAPTPRPKPAAPPPRTSAADVPGAVRAPIPGVVLNVTATPGEQVTASTKLLVLEAMKMENEIFAGVDGVVAEVHVAAQQEVRQGDLLVTITIG